MTALEEIKKALAAAEQFIVNGVELGYIRMPAPQTPDSAHDTLPMIRRAQTALESLQRENDELRKALLPFAELPDNAHGKHRYFLELLVCPDGDTPADGVKQYGEAIRTARTALASTGGEHHAE